jgi:ubiquinone/menaquinone biosynthesis C-methylase UbiE
MGFYDRYIFPHVLDLAMRGMNPLRADVLAPASGEVLEIGFGTGLNLAYYPATVRRLHALDPMDALQKRVAERIAAASFPVERHQLRADGQLPFDAARFDCVAVTWTLCSISDPLAALREMRRVLKPGAPLLFIEHGRSDDPKVARFQDRWNPIQNAIAGGCNVNRKIDALIREGGFAFEKLERYKAPGPRFLTDMYRGIARRG